MCTFGYVYTCIWWRRREKAVSAKGKYLIANVLWRSLERVTNWKETYSQFCEPVVAGCSTLLVKKLNLAWLGTPFCHVFLL